MYFISHTNYTPFTFCIYIVNKISRYQNNTELIGIENVYINM